VTVGLWCVGYLSWAWSTCWCQDCHVVREQTYVCAAEHRAETVDWDAVGDDCHEVRRTVTVRPDGSRLDGPWLPTPEPDVSLRTEVQS